MTLQSPILICGFNRADSLQQVLRNIPPSDHATIYISLDGPRKAMPDETLDCQTIAHDFAKARRPRTHIRNLKLNVGAAVNILTAIDWVMKREDSVIILEDDCVPSLDFFTFIQKALPEIRKNHNLWAISGSQPAPEQLFDGTFCLSAYPLIWGWGTDSIGWGRLSNALRALLIEGANYNYVQNLRDSPDEAFWRSGFRRSYEGYVDAWDLPVAYAMRRFHGRFIHSSKNFVTNIGTDSRATHTMADSSWTWLPTKTAPTGWKACSTQSSRDVDDWYRKHVFKITRLRPLSTTFNHFLDRNWRDATLATLNHRLKLAESRLAV